MEHRSVTPLGRQNMTAAWGKVRSLGEEAMNELFHHQDILSLDYDDQISYALQLGIMASETKDGTVEEFITRFEKEILNQDEEDD